MRASVVCCVLVLLAGCSGSPAQETEESVSAGPPQEQETGEAASANPAEAGNTSYAWRQTRLEFPVATTSVVSPPGAQWLLVGGEPRFHVERGSRELWINVTTDLVPAGDLQLVFEARSVAPAQELEVVTSGGTASVEVESPAAGDWAIRTAFASEANAGSVEVEVQALSPEEPTVPEEGWIEQTHEGETVTTSPATPTFDMEVDVDPGTALLRVHVAWSSPAPTQLRANLIDLDHDAFYDFYTYDGQGSIVVPEPEPGTWRVRLFSADGAGVGSYVTTIGTLPATPDG